MSHHRERMPQHVDLGPCCNCGKRGHDVNSILMLDVKLPPDARGFGWGCLVCNLPPDGAIAVLCDACYRAVESGQEQIRSVCLGYPREGGRISRASCTEPHLHDASKHPEEMAARN
jgi:hypothetical protein